MTQPVVNDSDVLSIALEKIMWPFGRRCEFVRMLAAHIHESPCASMLPLPEKCVSRCVCPFVAACLRILADVVVAGRVLVFICASPG